MKQRHQRRILAATLPLALALLACASGTKNAVDIRKSGFITDNCYQAILEIEPDERASGLVAGRESSYLRGKSADLRAMAVDNIVRYCIDSRGASAAADASGLKSRIDGLVGRGKIAFVYYNEKHSMMIGYRITGIGLRKKLEGIISPPDQRGTAENTTSRS